MSIIKFIKYEYKLNHDIILSFKSPFFREFVRSTSKRINLKLDHVELSIFGDFISHDNLLFHSISDDLAENSSVQLTDLFNITHLLGIYLLVLTEYQ